jgi:hypothetical protein
MTDYSELKRLAEAAIKSGSESGERWPQDDDWFEPERYGAELEYVKSISPTTVLELIAENEALRKDAERWRFVRNPVGNSSPFAIWSEKTNLFLGKHADKAIDAAMSKGNTE